MENVVVEEGLYRCVVTEGGRRSAVMFGDVLGF